MCPTNPGFPHPFVRPFVRSADQRTDRLMIGRTDGQWRLYLPYVVWTTMCLLMVLNPVWPTYPCVPVFCPCDGPKHANTESEDNGICTPIAWYKETNFTWTGSRCVCVCVCSGWMGNSMCILSSWRHVYVYMYVPVWLSSTRTEYRKYGFFFIRRVEKRLGIAQCARWFQMDVCYCLQTCAWEYRNL